MRKILVIALALAMLLVPVAALAEEGEENLLYNGDFAVASESAALPAGWEAEYYLAESGYAYFGADETAGVYVGIGNTEENDARVCQAVSVEPNACYRVSALVQTSGVTGGTGATLSIDNYAADGTYCYSENLFGDNDWRTVTMYVLTGAEQTELRVAMRLGGYGTLAMGQAKFADISLVRCEAPRDAVVIRLEDDHGTVTSVTQTEETTVEDVETERGSLVGLLALTVLCGAAFAALYRYMLRFEDAFFERKIKSGTIAVWTVLTAAFILRLALSIVYYGHPTDIGCFMAWGNAALNNGLSNFYTSGMFADYPPGYMYICAALSWICEILQLPYGSTAMAFVYKLPATFADLVSAYLVYRIARKNGVGEGFSLALTAVLALNPVLMFVSGAWGQIDTLLTLLFVVTIYLLQRDRRIAAGAVYGLAILLKPQALMLGPLFAVAFIADIFVKDGKKRLGETALAVLAALAVLCLGSLPFRGTQSWYWLIQKYMSTASSYPYAAIEAFNCPSLFGGNWKSVDATRLGVSFRIWGTAAIVTVVMVSGYIYAKSFRKSRGALYLTSAMLIMGVFTFGHYMHERYMLPVLMLLMMAYLYYRDRRILAAFGAVTVSSLLNVRAAMFIVDHQTARGTLYEFITRFGSALTVLACAYLIYITVRVALQGETVTAAVLPKQEPKPAARRVPMLPTKPTDLKLPWGKRDWVYVVAVTAVYAAVALTNLGTLSAPETYWETDTAGDGVTVTLDGEREIAEFWVYGNIRKGGVLLIDDGVEQTTFEQIYDDMFRWRLVGVNMQSDTVTVSLYSGSVKINEMAFFDAYGVRIPVTVTAATAGAERLFDEQQTVPDIPSYYNGMYFDELYHGRTAYEHLHNLSPYENSHPPLGKLFIMIGIWLCGMNPFGWRLIGALFGIAMLPILYLFGKRLFKNAEFALVATGLFAFDFMHFTQTRIATIDVYAVFFILLMYYYMYQYISMNFFADELKRTYKPLFLAGLFFGIGAACKWTCIYAGIGLGVLFFGSLIARYFEYLKVNRYGSAAQKERVRPFRTYALKTVGMCCIFYIAIPVAIYFLSYLPYFIYEAGETAGYGFGDMCRTFWKYQEFMFNYHSDLVATHPYQSSWYSWPLTLRPMWYYFNGYGGGRFVSTLSASGNPAVWWISTFGAVALLTLRILKKIEPDRALQILCIGVLANYLPWVLVSRCTFIYHFFATVPFILLSTVYLLQWLERKYPALSMAKWCWLTLAILFFILLYPGISGLAVSPEWAAFIAKLPGGTLMYGA